MRSPQNVLRTELVNGKRWMKENGTHTKTFDGNWDVEPSFGCLFLLAYQCSSFLSVRSSSSTEKMQMVSIFGKRRVGPASLKE